MKSSEWVTTSIYKFFKSGIANTGEVINLKGLFKNLKIFSIVSSIEYTPNLISIEQVKHTTSTNTFYIDFKATKGNYQITTHPEITDSARDEYKTNTRSFYGRGFIINANCGKGGSDSAYSEISYRYKTKSGNFSNWVVIVQSSGVTHTPLNVTFDEFNLDESTEIQIKYILNTRRYSTAFIRYSMKTITYLSTTTHIVKGTYHWFAFAE